VFAKSTARKKGVPSWKSYKALREKLVADQSLVEQTGDPAVLVFSEDIAFNSPSAAASVVMARAANGRRNWKVKGTGQSYADWQEEKLASVVGPDQLEGDDAEDS
jgi:hypothetical protein